MKRVVLAALREKRGYTYRELAAECRKHPGGEKLNVGNLCAYFSGSRPIGEVHFAILCKVLRVKPEDVMTQRYLCGSPNETGE